MDDPSCQVCLNTQSNRVYAVREMMFGTRDEFSYLECSDCGCLQLLGPPSNLEKYYPSDYYSFASKQQATSSAVSPKRIVRSVRNRAYLAELPALTSVLDRVAAYPQFRAVAATRPCRSSRILDVGCGAGKLLKDLVSLGFTQVLGIDPFLQQDIRYRTGLEVRKCSLGDLQGTEWDLIMFHHSFEHVPDPLATLRTVTSLLSDRGCCLIRIPVVAWAWRNYGVQWVEIDAPRHFFLHTERSLNLLANRAGLRVLRTYYDSDGFEMWGSELYKRDIPLNALRRRGEPTEFFSTGELRSFRDGARKLNDSGEAGRAAFYLSRS